MCPRSARLAAKPIKPRHPATRSPLGPQFINNIDNDPTLDLDRKAHLFILSDFGDLSTLNADIPPSGSVPGPPSGWISDNEQHFSAGRLGPDNPIGYTGHVFDPEIGMYLARFRHYRPDLGRWMQPDPIGYMDTMSLYAYVGASPVGTTDPSGLLPKCDRSSEGQSYYTVTNQRAVRPDVDPDDLLSVKDFNDTINAVAGILMGTKGAAKWIKWLKRLSKGPPRDPGRNAPWYNDAKDFQRDQSLSDISLESFLDAYIEAIGTTELGGYTSFWTQTALATCKCSLFGCDWDIDKSTAQWSRHLQNDGEPDAINTRWHISEITQQLMRDAARRAARQRALNDPCGSVDPDLEPPPLMP